VEDVREERDPVLALLELDREIVDKDEVVVEALRDRSILLLSVRRYLGKIARIRKK
jgi:hypothetical protein